MCLVITGELQKFKDKIAYKYYAVDSDGALYAPFRNKRVRARRYSGQVKNKRTNPFRNNPRQRVVEDGAIHAFTSQKQAKSAISWRIGSEIYVVAQVRLSGPGFYGADAEICAKTCEIVKIVHGRKKKLATTWLNSLRKKKC